MAKEPRWVSVLADQVVFMSAGIAFGSWQGSLSAGFFVYVVLDYLCSKTHRRFS